MALVTGMVGRWPEDLNDSINDSYKYHEQSLPVPITGYQAELAQIFPSPSPASATSSTSNTDELFFDVETSFEAMSHSYLTFEPVVSSVSGNEPIDWRRYDPPAELLQVQDDTSEEIRGILQSSIERIQARHVEEEEQRAATARRQKPLNRTKRASIKPRKDTTTSGGLGPLVPSDNSRLSVGSQLSLASNDSGYHSRSPDIGSPVSPAKQEKGFLSGFAAFIKPKKGDTLMSPLQRLGEMSSVLALSNTSPATSRLSTSTPAADSEASGSTTGECVSCLDDFATSGLIKLTCHSYCPPCFLRLINNALETEAHFPPKCCLNPISYSKISPHIPPKTQKLYKSRNAEWSIPVSQRVYCSHTPCNAFIPQSSINLPQRKASCPKCTKKTCTTCRSPSHGNADCPSDPELIATTNLAEMQGWKRCYACHAFVEHNQGCRHMTCRCTAQFCYICSARWRTCACTDAQLVTLQAETAARQQETAARTARQRRLTEEEEENLRLVADFIRAEEERERIAAEEERVREAEIRRIEEEEARLREQARRESLEAKFRALEREMEGLHQYQQSLMSSRYEFTTSMHSQTLSQQLDTLTLRHSEESNALAIASRTTITGLENIFEEEYLHRIAEEHDIETKYLSELHTYWDSKPNAAHQIREARDDLRREQSKEYTFWDQHRRMKIQALAEGEKRKAEFLETRQRSEVKEIKGRAEIEGVEERKRRGAEGEWVDVVVREQMGMLNEIWRREVEGVGEV